MQAQNYHVVVTLLLALADVLTLAASEAGASQKRAKKQGGSAGAATGQPQQPPGQQQGGLAAAAAALAQGVLSRRLKALYFSLSSEVRGKANAALRLLAALAGQGAEATRELARLFDFSLAALPTLARLPRQRKDEGLQVRRGWGGSGERGVGGRWVSSLSF